MGRIRFYFLSTIDAHNAEEIEMDETDALARPITMLNEHKTLISGTHDHDRVAEQVPSLTDRLGQDKALEKRRDANAQLQVQIEAMSGTPST